MTFVINNKKHGIVVKNIEESHENLAIINNINNINDKISLRPFQ